MTARLSSSPWAALAAVLVLAPVVLAGLPLAPAAAAPPPVEVCGVCGDQLSTIGPQEGVPMNVEYSVANISVRDDGSSHWHARVWITDSAARRFEANASLREHVVRTTLEDGRTAVEAPRNLRTRIDGSTLVVDFDVENVAHRSVGGVWLVDFLTSSYHGRTLEIDADTLRVRGPNGTVVARAPESARVRTGSVVWRPAGGDMALDGGDRLAFAGTDGVVAQFATTLAITLDEVTLAGPWLLFVGGVPAVVLGGGLWLLRTERVSLPSPDPTVLAQGIVALGAGIAGLGALSMTLEFLFGTAVVGGGSLAVSVAVFSGLYALVAAGATVLDAPSVGRSVAWTLGAGAVVVLVAGVVSADAFAVALYSLPVTLFFPLGRARDADRRWTRAIVAGVLLSPFALALVIFPFDGWLTQVVLTVALLLPWAFATAALGLPLYLLGHGVDGADGADGDGREADRPVADASGD